MARLGREIRSFFRHPLLVGDAALLASLAGGVWILISFGARSFLAAAVVYSACGVVAYVYQREVRLDIEPNLFTLILMIIAWPLPVIVDAYHVMGWGDWNRASRFSVYSLESTPQKPGTTRNLGEFRKWDEAVNCARQKAKELNAKVHIGDLFRRWKYVVHAAGSIERRKIARY